MATKRFYIVLAALLMSLAMLAGCGKKGHLVMPDGARTAPSGEESAPSAEPENEGPSLPSAPATP